MQLLETVADQLAKKALDIIGLDETTTLIDDMGASIGASSQTLQEAFLTAVRIRRAEVRAIQTLDKYIEKSKTNGGD